MQEPEKLEFSLVHRRSLFIRLSRNDIFGQFVHFAVLSHSRKSVYRRLPEAESCDEHERGKPPHDAVVRGSKRRDHNEPSSCNDAGHEVWTGPNASKLEVQLILFSSTVYIRFFEFENILGIQNCIASFY